MTGHVRRRGARSWEIKFDLGVDTLSGKRRIRYAAFKGTKREAQIKMAALITSVGTGSYVEPSKTTLADFVRARVDQWEAAADISARTAQRYRQLVENQIVPQRPRGVGTDQGAWHPFQAAEVQGWSARYHTAGCLDRRAARPPQSRAGTTNA